MSEKPKVVILGGGNGTSRLLQALVPLIEDDKIGALHALVLNADDGGSTGRLRDQYDVAAMGDLTKCLMALSGFHGDSRGEQLLKALDHRFEGGDFNGHTLRNIFLTSLESTSDIDSGIAMMARILQVPKEAGVVPVTLAPLTQQVVIERGGETRMLGEGQHFISHNVDLQADEEWRPGDVRVQFSERAELNPRAKEILDEATHIIVAPGHTYGTILPALALPGLGEAIANTKAHLSVVMSLLTTPKQTKGWSGEDFVKVYESYLGKKVDMVIGNTGQVDIELVKGQAWVRFEEVSHDYELVNEELVSSVFPEVSGSDVVPRAIVVHDSVRLRELFAGIL